MRLTRLKHAAFLLEADGRRLAVDLGDYIQPEAIRALGKLDAVVVSHQHGDHFQPANVLAAAVPLAAPADVLALLPEGLDASVLRLGETVTVAGFEITPTVADHGPKLSNPIENFGLIIAHGDHRVLYVGDAAVVGDPPRGQFDLVLVSVDGTGFVFGPEEGAEFIRRLGHRGRVVPIHDGDGEEPWHALRFGVLAADVCRPVMLEPGQSVEVAS